METEAAELYLYKFDYSITYSINIGKRRRFKKNCWFVGLLCNSNYGTDRIKTSDICYSIRLKLKWRMEYDYDKLKLVSYIHTMKNRGIGTGVRTSSGHVPPLSKLCFYPPPPTHTHTISGSPLKLAPPTLSYPCLWKSVY